jgi:rhodanese-related sulfurtransferase
MGTFGVSQGFALVLDRKTGIVVSAARGVDRPAELSAEATEELIYKCFDAAENRTLKPMSITRLNAGRQNFLELHFGFRVQTSTMFVIDQSLLGVVAFSPTINGSLFTAEEEELFSAQVAAFMVFMKNVKAFETIQTLNRGLEQTNEELRQTIVDLKEAHKKITVLERTKATLRNLIVSEAARFDRATVLDVALILIAATVLAFLFNYSNPNGISLLPETMFYDEVPQIDAKQAMVLLQSGQAVIVDARPQEFFKRKHITEAINVPAPLFQMLYKMKLSKLLDADKTVIVYGRNISSRYDQVIARQLKLRNHEQVHILIGGLKDWEKEGYSVAP